MSDRTIYWVIRSTATSKKLEYWKGPFDKEDEARSVAHEAIRYGYNGEIFSICTSNLSVPEVSK